ncbi:Ger(x)C family spore germination protein [Paenibacillus sp. SYP-B3998]|uniref:Ger(X)C family spore germination protein n=1 Tax=Paenibacillus sp. SYP-B3998 TaxID=2678564 RepID=A0A6G3ZWE3_9BACL|nr:Ger(x)C family spore germination protein [Paenibacillus sp. SYP-B3998]NEW05737.1 Ger(x)C family spore germination protein [Paenibacillus sp. SYP-B3998]
MKRFIIGLVALSLLITGCVDQINIEDVSLSLLIGIDLDENNNLIFSTSSPVFNKEAKIKEEEYTSQATTMRKSRDKDDQTFIGLTTGGKAQVILVGKRVMQHNNWFQLLEPFFRDAKNTLNVRIVMVDGPAYEVVQYAPKDKPRLPLYLSKLIDTANRRNINVKTTLESLRRLTLEKGITASVTELHKDGKLIVTGTALLEESGKYKFSIGPDETRLLRILQDETKGEFPFTYKAIGKPKEGVFPNNAYSFSAQKISVKTKTGFKENKFKFDMDVKMRVVLTERLFPLDVRTEADKLERDMEQHLKKGFNGLISKIQGAKIDPIGMGLYARAYEYSHWKSVQDKWGEAFSDAEVNVKVKVIIASMGPTK